MSSCNCPKVFNVHQLLTWHDFSDKAGNGMLLGSCFAMKQNSTPNCEITALVWTMLYSLSVTPHYFLHQHYPPSSLCDEQLKLYTQTISSPFWWKEWFLTLSLPLRQAAGLCHDKARYNLQTFNIWNAFKRHLTVHFCLTNKCVSMNFVNVYHFV